MTGTVQTKWLIVKNGQIIQYFTSISLDTWMWNVWAAGEVRCKVRESHKSLSFILSAPWIFVPNYTALHLRVSMFQPGPQVVDKPAHQHLHRLRLKQPNSRISRWRSWIQSEEQNNIPHATDFQMCATQHKDRGLLNLKLEVSGKSLSARKTENKKLKITTIATKCVL